MSSHTPPAAEWLPLPVVAQATGLSRESLQRRIDRGHLEGKQVRGRWLVRIADTAALYRDGKAALGLPPRQAPPPFNTRPSRPAS